MKKGIAILCMLFVAAPFLASAQGTTNDLETDFGGRMSVTFDKKIKKGVHLKLDGEARFKDNFGTFGRYDLGVGMTYKISDLFKVGGGYIFINRLNSSNEWKTRHRVYGDAVLTLRSGDWRFSLKERLQLTHRDVNNKYQNVPNSLSLKSRIKVAYKGFYDITPYGYVELRNVFNDPSCSATWSTSSSSYSDYSFTGYNDVYINRVRGVLGAEWKLNKQHSFDFFLMSDYCYDKEIDTNAEGTKLKSLTYDQNFNVGIGIGYEFSF